VKWFAPLLLVGVLRHYGWEWVKPEWQAQVWNISGAAIILACLTGAAWKWKPLLPVAVWWIAEEAQVIICSTLFMIRPWKVNPGEAQCSALIGLDLSAIGILWVAVTLVANKEEEMMDPRPVTTIEGLDAHLYHIMAQLKEIRDIQTTLATRAELDSKIAALEQKISQQSPKSVWRGITEISVGIAAIAAAGGVVVAVVRYLHL
jgi:hypothetical protein